MRELILQSHLCPGDDVVLTAAIKGLQLANPHQFKIAMDTLCHDLWSNNPYVVNRKEFITTPLQIDIAMKVIPKPITQHYCRIVADYLGGYLRVPRFDIDLKGDLHLSDQEKKPIHDTPYFIINAGGKGDIATKWWPHDRYQSVVDHFKDRILFAQVGKIEFNHFHRPLNNVINLLGKTDTRQFLRWVYHSQGVLTPLSFAMHTAAAFDKPCVVIAGDREEEVIYRYPSHLILRNNLPCHACWKEFVNQGEPHRRCKRPQGAIAECMSSITVKQVIDALEKVCDGSGAK